LKLESIAASMLTCVVLLTGCARGGEAPKSAALPAVGQHVAVDGGHYTNITVPELQAMLADKDFPLINVHVPFAGDLPGTDESIPYNRIESNLDRLPADKNAKIVLYCRNGPMSVTAATTLARLGYTNVYNLVGGFTAWVEWGLPMAAR
jgi:rhodanese-related sulfurtransferase